MWNRMLGHRAEINLSEALFAQRMGIPPERSYQNPFNDSLRKYDDVLLELQKDLTDSIVRAYGQTFAPNVDISSEDVRNKMVEALADGDSIQTTYGKVLVYDAQWIAKYLQENYLNPETAREKSMQQLVKKVRNSFGWRHKEIETILQGDTLIIPFYASEDYNDTYSLSSSTVDVMNALDKLIQVLLMDESPADVKAKLFTPVLHHWWNQRPRSNEMFRKQIINDASSPVEEFRPYKGRSEIELKFKHASDAKIIATRIFEFTDK